MSNNIGHEVDIPALVLPQLSSNGQIAPNLRHLFNKPKEIMAIKLANIVGMLVTSSTLMSLFPLH